MNFWYGRALGLVKTKRQGLEFYREVEEVKEVRK
jgi:hypothetical protein